MLMITTLCLCGTVISCSLLLMHWRTLSIGVCLWYMVILISLVCHAHAHCGVTNPRQHSRYTVDQYISQSLRDALDILPELDSWSVVRTIWWEDQRFQWARYSTNIFRAMSQTTLRPSKLSLRSSQPHSTPLDRNCLPIQASHRMYSIEGVSHYTGHKIILVSHLSRQ